MSKVYNKNNKKNTIIRPLSLAATSVLALATLASCKANSNVYAAINADSVYSQIGNYSVTNKELFDNMVWSGADTLNTYINNALVKSYYDDIKDNVENGGEHQAEYVQSLRELLVVASYNASDYSSYFSIRNKDEVNYNPDVFNTSTKEAIDNLYIQGIKISQDDFMALVEVKSTDDETLVDISYAAMSNAQKEVLKLYYSELAQKQFALNALNDTISDYEDDNNDDDLAYTDEDYTHYYSDSDIISKYKSEVYKKRTSSNGILIRFESSDEINATYKAFGVKLYRSKLYYIRQYNVTKKGTSGHNLTDAEYNDWYENFDFTDEANKDNYQVLSDRAVLELYIQMYNYVYTYKSELPYRDYLSDRVANSTYANRRKLTEGIAAGNSDDATKYADEIASGKTVDECVLEELKATLESEDYTDIINHKATDLENISSTLTSLMFDNTKDLKYSTSGTEISEKFYMCFKLDNDETGLKDADGTDLKLYYKADVNGDLTQIDENGKEEKCDSSIIDWVRSAKVVEKVIDILKEESLTSSYISEKLNDAKKDAKISIYDSNLSIQYAVSYSDYYSKTSGKAKEDDIIAKVEYDGDTTYIKTSDLFTELETNNGVTEAVDILTKKIIKDTDEYAKTEKNVDDYYTTLNNVLTSFANDGFSSYGYSSSIGKYNFMMAYYHSASVDEIINEVYRVNAASSQILNDYSSDTALIELLTSYASQAYNNSFTISATNLKVYVDFDEDNTADAFNWNTIAYNNADGSAVTYSDLAKELINQFIKLLQNDSTTYKDNLTTLVEEYTNAARFTTGYDLNPDSENNYSPAEPETYWAKFKRYGLQVTTTDYDSVTNSTSYATIETTLKKELCDIYSRDEFIINSTAQTEYLDTLPYDNSGDGLVNNQGYNLLVVTSATVNASAKFESTDDVNGIYTNLWYYYHEKLSHIDNLYNDKDTLNANQVKAYILEYADNSTSKTIPSDISDAITSFLSPVYTKYTGTETQREILISWCESTTNSTFAFTNSLNEDKNNYYYKDGSVETYTTRLNNIRSINKSQADEYYTYNDFDQKGGTSSVYDDWWTDLANYIEGKKK